MHVLACDNFPCAVQAVQALQIAGRALMWTTATTATAARGEGPPRHPRLDWPRVRGVAAVVQQAVRPALPLYRMASLRALICYSYGSYHRMLLHRMLLLLITQPPPRAPKVTPSHPHTPTQQRLMLLQVSVSVLLRDAICLLEMCICITTWCNSFKLLHSVHAHTNTTDHIRTSSQVCGALGKTVHSLVLL